MPPAKSSPAFPFFIPVEPRSLSAVERSTVELMASAAGEAYLGQVGGLKVVGRCGCGGCPIVFFREHRAQELESHLCMFSGKDRYGGLVGVTLYAKDGMLSQLEYFSVDGHDPWEPPEAEHLALQP